MRYVFMLADWSFKLAHVLFISKRQKYKLLLFQTIPFYNVFTVKHPLQSKLDSVTGCFMNVQFWTASSLGKAV